MKKIKKKVTRIRAIQQGFYLILVIVFSGCQYLNKTDTLFKLLNPNKTGIYFNNKLEESHQMNIITYPDFYSGGGVSIGDIDNDGLADIFFVGNQVYSKLYKNKGNMVFEDITSTSKLDKMEEGWYTGTSMVDLNADGYLDIYICRSGMGLPKDRANLLYINNRDGTFTEKAEEYGLDNEGYGVNAYFFDYDRDGDLDVYVANQTTAKLNSSDAARLRNVSDPYSGDKLYENIGNTFIDITEKSGIYSSKVGYAHGISVGDINDDGWDDIYVSNDFFEYDYLYLNNGDKTFTENIKKATRHISHFSMGNDMADFNNDGLLDLIVLDMVAEDNRRLYMNTGGTDQKRFDRTVQHGLHYQYMFNVLHLNNGNETFSEIGMVAGISRTDWSWAPLFADFDNDGFKDLYVSNGIRKDIRNIDWGISYKNMIQFVTDFTELEDSQWDMILKTLPFEPVVNYMFRNNGDLTFSKVMKEWGMDQKSYSNGVAFGDLDNDGDLDLVVNNVDAEAFIYENRDNQSNSIRFKFYGHGKNPMGLGTKVRIYHGDKFQYQQHYSTRGFRSSMEPIMHFGMGTDTLITRVEVVWPDGKNLLLQEIKANQTVSLNYSESVENGSEIENNDVYYFEDITEQYGLSIRHHENDKIDFVSEPMLSYDISRLGPTLAVGDVNADGLDDFYLGGAYQYEGQLFIQNLNGEFQSSQIELWKQDRLFEDTGAEFFDIDNDGDMDLYVVSGSYEKNAENFSLQDRLYINDGKGIFTKNKDLIPLFNSSGSVVKPEDFDQDGDLDLFIGGRMIPGQYPMFSDSYLLLNQDGILVDATEKLAPGMKNLGLVTDAVWSDYDLDRDMDLIIVGEWMPVIIFNNDSGNLRKAENTNDGLDFSSGWWWSIEAFDFDSDGDDDYVLGNMGLNYKFRASQKEPLELFINDFDNNGKMDFVIGYHQDGKIFPTVDRAKTLIQNRYLRSKIPTNNEYAISTLYDIYGEKLLENALNYKIYTLASGYLENNGNGEFKFKPFDNYAQISNINSIIFQDVDLDSYEDLIMAGNLYSTEAETIRNDASIGVWMKGDGKGNFKSIPFQKSGLFMEGDVRVLKKIRTSNGHLILCAKNNDYVQLIKFYSRQ